MLSFRYIAKFLVPVIILTVGCLLLNDSFNQHYHKLSGGFVVKHAHPYQKDNSGLPFQSHHHNSFEFFLLNQLAVFLFIFSSYLCLLFLFQFLLNRLAFPISIGFFQSDYYYLKNNRAPPLPVY